MCVCVCVNFEWIIHGSHIHVKCQAFIGYFLQHPFSVIHNYYKPNQNFFLVKTIFFSFLGGSILKKKVL